MPALAQIGKTLNRLWWRKTQETLQMQEIQNDMYYSLLVAVSDSFCMYLPFLISIRYSTFNNHIVAGARTA
jgi:hypothetical protein